MSDYQALVERIVNTKTEKLEVKAEEIEEEITNIYKAQNPLRMIQLYEAYKQWQIRNKHVTNITIQTATRIAKENLDGICQIADIRSRLKKDINTPTEYLIEEDPLPESVVGEIRQFYRNSINYHPFEPSNN